MFAPVEPSGHVVAGDMPQSAVVDGDLGQERSDAGQPGRWTSTGGSRPASRLVGQAAPREVPLLNPLPGATRSGAAALSVPGRCEGDVRWSGSRTIGAGPARRPPGCKVALVADWLDVRHDGVLVARHTRSLAQGGQREPGVGPLPGGPRAPAGCVGPVPPPWSFSRSCEGSRAGAASRLLSQNSLTAAWSWASCGGPVRCAGRCSLTGMPSPGRGRGCGSTARRLSSSAQSADHRGGPCPGLFRAAR